MVTKKRSAVQGFQNERFRWANNAKDETPMVIVGDSGFEVKQEGAKQDEARE